VKLKHFFLPHPHTHKKAHLLSIKAFLVYFLFFIVLQSGFSFINKVHPGVLGISTAIDYEEVIKLTNVERQKNGLAPLSENKELDASAFAKGENMYAENYWAHYSPSGKDPWGFMKEAGYTYSYAGENLAKNFYTAQDVVTAWMNSPTHRENMLNTHYTEIGISVNEGILEGQKTILVIQHFGRPTEYLAQSGNSAVAQAATSVPAPTKVPIIRTNTTPTPSIAATPTPTVSPSVEQLVQANSLPITPASTNNNVLVQGFSIDQYQIFRLFGLGFLGFIALLIGLDLYMIRKRLIHRFATHHISHFALLSLAITTLMHSGPGQIM
jgi:hypothetical protein